MTQSRNTALLSPADMAAAGTQEADGNWSSMSS